MVIFFSWSSSIADCVTDCGGGGGVCEWCEGGGEDALDASSAVLPISCPSNYRRDKRLSTKHIDHSHNYDIEPFKGRNFSSVARNSIIFIIFESQ